jgi:DNA-binding Lrp family transcriptional regulator
VSNAFIYLSSVEIMNNNQVAIDSIDAKLITLLLKNARTKTKDLAEACGISSTAVGNRIKKLKKDGVITGSALMLDMSQMGFMYPALVSIERMREEHFAKVISLIKSRSGLVLYNPSFGKSDFSIFLVARTLRDLDCLKQSIRKYSAGRISVDLWSTPFFCFENLNIEGK